MTERLYSEATGFPQLPEKPEVGHGCHQEKEVDSDQDGLRYEVQEPGDGIYQPSLDQGAQ